MELTTLKEKSNVSDNLQIALLNSIDEKLTQLIEIMAAK